MSDVWNALGLPNLDDDDASASKSVVKSKTKSSAKAAPASVWQALGLPDIDDSAPAHPVSRPMIGDRPVEDWEVTPGAKPPTHITINPNPPKPLLSQVHEAINPASVIPAALSKYGSDVGEYASAGTGMFNRGMQEISSGQPATGVGNVALGALTTAMSPVTGGIKAAVTDPLTQATGNPEFAERASMFVPINVGGPAARTALHDIHPMTKAADEVARIANPENIPNMLERLQSNSRLRPIDTNDQLRMAGQGLIASPNSPGASRVLTENMRDSAAGARDAVKGTYNEAMGPPPNLFEEKLRLENKAKAIGLSKIAPPLIAAKPVDTSGVIADIDKALNPAAVKMTPGTTITPTPLQQELVGIRQQLASGDQEVLTDAGRLHEIQSELRIRADDLMSSATGADRRLGRELKNYRNKLVDAIDQSAPGYKEGLKAFKDQKDIERAYEFGKKSLSTAEEYDPSFVKAWVEKKGRSPEELAAARLGQRYAIEKKMGSIKQSALDPARSGTDVPQIEFNKLNIQHLHGKENTAKMFKHLQDERDIALTNNRGLANSKTAESQAYQKHLEPREVSRPHSNLPQWATALGGGVGSTAFALSGNPSVAAALGAAAGGGMLAARGGKSMVDWLARRGEIARNKSIADIITQNTPKTRAALMSAAQRVGQRNKLQNLIAPP